MIVLTPVSPSPLHEAEDARLRSIARSFSERDDRFRAKREEYAELLPETTPGADVAALHVDDFSVIPHLQHILAVEQYPSRAFVRARDCDMVAGTFAPIPGYPDYLSGHLGLGRSTYCRVSPAPDKLIYATFAALFEDDRAQAEIAAWARDRSDEVWVHPYMGHEWVWRYARLLAQHCGRSVRVLGPLPVITERANDKLWFAEVVRSVLAPENALATCAGRSPEEIARLLHEMATDSPRVALKLVNGASGMGTGIFAQQEILGLSPQSLQARVTAWLSEMEWEPDDQPISVERWETNVLGSPSVQLWLPPIGEGTPLMEGIFDQLFYPEQEHVFLGSVPSRLPAPVRNAVGEACVRIGRVFQYLGYVGRCSFDTILCGQDLTTVTIKLTECNGRWGGTSTPMSLMNRLFGDYRTQPYISRDFVDPCLEGVPFDAFARRLDDILYRRSNGRGWAIVYNVGCLQPAGKLDILTLGDTLEAAEQRQEEFRELVRSRF